jgi:hypothetical protein
VINIVTAPELSAPPQPPRAAAAPAKNVETPIAAGAGSPAHPHIELPEWVVARLLLENKDLSQAIVDLVVWADRVKCWLYQADAELEDIAGKLAAPGAPAEPREVGTKPPKRSKLTDIISSLPDEKD